MQWIGQCTVEWKGAEGRDSAHGAVDKEQQLAGVCLAKRVLPPSESPHTPTLFDR